MRALLTPGNSGSATASYSYWSQPSRYRYLPNGYLGAQAIEIRITANNIASGWDWRPSENRIVLDH